MKGFNGSEHKLYIIKHQNILAIKKHIRC